MSAAVDLRKTQKLRREAESRTAEDQKNMDERRDGGELLLSFRPKLSCSPGTSRKARVVAGRTLNVIGAASLRSSVLLLRRAFGSLGASDPGPQAWPGQWSTHRAGKNFASSCLVRGVAEPSIEAMAAPRFEPQASNFILTI